MSFDPLILRPTKQVFNLFQEGQHLIDGVEILKEQLDLFSQLQILHNFHDPIAEWMDSVFQGVSHVTVLGTQINGSSKYKILNNFCYKCHMFSPLSFSIAYKEFI